MNKFTLILPIFSSSDFIDSTEKMLKDTHREKQPRLQRIFLL